MDLDAFLAHEASSGGRRGQYLRRWNKPKETGQLPEIRLWLHTKQMFVARWVHQWPRLITRTDRQTGLQRVDVWGRDFVCWEEEVVLKRQRDRDDDDVRLLPPCTCPICKTNEVLYQGVLSGDIALTEPIFRFVGTDDEQVLTAGGMCGLYNSKNLSATQKAEMRRARIRPDEAWKENVAAKCQYTFTVVEHDAPENGVLIADECEAMGNKMKAAIGAEYKRVGREKGNPLRNPYAFQWEYYAEKQFEKKYAVFALSSEVAPLTDEIRELIEGDAPKLDKHMRPGSAKQLRMEMEAAALVDLPWDYIFDAAEKAEEEMGSDDEEDTSTDFPTEELEEEAPKERKQVQVPGVKRTPAESAAMQSLAESAERIGKAAGKETRASAPAKPPPAKVEEAECDHCGKPFAVTETTCPHCGTVYDDEGIAARPCVQCNELVECDAANVQKGRVICGACGTVIDAEKWEVVSAPEPAEPPKRTRSQAAGKKKLGAPPAPKPLDMEQGAREALGDDDLPWGK